MKNLKFRAWDKRREDFRNDIFVDTNGNLYQFSKITGYGQAITYLDNKHIVLMQSTGFFDKNGKEIFEGDILNCGYIFTGSPFEEQDDYIEDIGVVKIVNCGAVVKIYEEFENLIDVLNTCEDIEVIGNIYENKELLENDR